MLISEKQADASSDFSSCDLFIITCNRIGDLLSHVWKMNGILPLLTET